MRFVRDFLREVLESARSQRVASSLTVLAVAGMVIAVMLTTGRSVGAEQRVLDSLDEIGTRSIVVRADDEAGVTSSVLDRVAVLQSIEWAAAFTAAIDGNNALIPDGPRVGIRYAYGAHLDVLGVPAHSPDPGRLAYASGQALQRLGLTDVGGGISLESGAEYGVGGRIQTPDFLREMEPLVLVPVEQPTGAEPVNVIVVIADTPELVAPVSAAVLSVLGATDATKATITTSQALAELRALLESQLGTFSRGLVVALVGVTGALVAAILLGLVVMRRKDFGRRRALGATRPFIVGLLVVQAGFLSLVAIGVGLIVSAAMLTIAADPLPDAEFILALSLTSLLVAVSAAIVPAVVASFREPVRELRVP